MSLTGAVCLGRQHKFFIVFVHCGRFAKWIFFPFYFIFRMKIFALDEITCRRSCFTRADPNYIAVINAVASFSGTFLFFILDLTKPGTDGTDITFHLSNGVRLRKVNILSENACETN